MARLAVFASGNGSNFEAIVSAIDGTGHEVCCLICDEAGARVFERAERLAVPAHHVSYGGRNREQAEAEIEAILARYRPDLIALAGFMRILTPSFVDTRRQKIVNIHPTLLPAFPGAHGLEESYRAGGSRLGITIHYVDRGVDTGPIIRQVSITRSPIEDYATIERRIHDLEHRHYPAVILSLLDQAGEE